MLGYPVYMLGYPGYTLGYLGRGLPLEVALLLRRLRPLGYPGYMLGYPGYISMPEVRDVAPVGWVLGAVAGPANARVLLGG